MPPADGLRTLDEIREMAPRFGRFQSIAGYSVLTVGLCLILQPAAREGGGGSRARRARGVAAHHR